MQYAVPIADTASVGTWLPASGSTLYDMVDEIVADDLDYVQANAGPSVSPLVQWRLSAANDPLVSTGYVVRWRARLQFGPIITVTQTMRLFQGTTLVASEAVSLFGGNTPITEFTRPLSTGEADAITNHADLYVEFEHSMSDAAPVVQITLARLELPDAGFAHLDVANSGWLVADMSSGFYLQASGAGLTRVSGLEQVGIALVLDSSVGFKVAS